MSLILTAFAVSDFDRDGKLEVAVAFQGSSIAILTGNGDGTFRQTGTYGPPPILLEVSPPGDFNGDGIPDLAFSNFNGDEISLLLGKGDGTFEVTSRSANPAVCCLIAGEFNADGRTDLLASARNSSSVVLILVGKSTPGPPTPSSVSMAASPSPSFAGESVGLAAYVVAQQPIGTVTFRDGLTVLGTAAVSSKASAELAVPLFSAGLHSLYADFSGNATDLASTSASISQNVLPEIVPIPIPPGSPPLTGNLLINPGAESLLLGWSGAGFDITSAAPHSGAESFYATQNLNLFGSQTTTLEGVPNVNTGDIDSGILSANYSYWYKNRTSATGGRYQITLTFYDSSAVRIGRGLSILRQGSLTWTNDSGSIPIPPGTRFIAHTMDFSGTTDTGQFDDNALTVSRLFPTLNLLSDPGAESGMLASPWWPNPGAPPSAIVNGPTYFGSSGGAPHSGTYMFYGGRSRMRLSAKRWTFLEFQ